MNRVERILQEALDTYRRKNKEYKSNYLAFGPIAAALFPNGLHCKTEEDFQRLGLLIPLITKLVRYCHNFETGHEDSLRDTIVYSALLLELQPKKMDEFGLGATTGPLTGTTDDAAPNPEPRRNWVGGGRTGAPPEGWATPMASNPLKKGT